MIDFHPTRGRAQAPSLVDQVVQAFTHAIGQQTLRPGMPAPSVRAFAQLERGKSPQGTEGARWRARAE